MTAICKCSKGETTARTETQQAQVEAVSIASSYTTPTAERDGLPIAKSAIGYLHGAPGRAQAEGGPVVAYEE